MEELNTQEQELLELAKQAARNAYSPYSGFKVGSAVLGKDGRMFAGCNVENASYSLTLCAERNAIFSAVAAGCRTFTAIAIYVDSDELFPPCGACRQVIYEFGEEIVVIYANRNSIHKSDISRLLPGAFKLDMESR